jgi:peptidoglycan/LPS O-acetylase OafA/YrhL
MSVLMPKHFKLIDIVRGFCALAVVIFHYQHFYYADPQHVMSAATKATQPFYGFLGVLYDSGFVAVSMFWLISGFVFSHVYESGLPTDPKIYFVNRFARLYPLHFITLVIVLILQLLNLNFVGHYQIYKNTDLFHFILSVFFVSGWFKSWESFNGPIWSVSIELIVYAAFFAYLYVKRWQLFVAAGTFIVAMAGFFITKHPLFQCFADFFAGIIIYKINIMGANKGLKTNIAFSVCLTVATLAFALAISQVAQLSKYVTEFSRHFVFASLLWLIAAIEVNFGSAKVKFLHWIGDITYASYLIHVPLQLVILLALDGFFHSRGVVSTGWFFVSFIVSLIGLSYLTFVFVEKPLQMYVRAGLLGKKTSK